MDTYKQAANDLYQLAGKPCDENMDITVTRDGTWSTRGFTSQFGGVMSFDRTGFGFCGTVLSIAINASFTVMTIKAQLPTSNG